MMTLILVSIVTLCPAVVCSYQDCCHRTPPCPYSILAKGKTNPAAAHTIPVQFLPCNPAPTAVSRYAALQSEFRLPDASGLFLRNHVLLI